MKYRVGDKVKVKTNLEIGKYYGGYYFNDSMANLKGKILTIRSVAAHAYVVNESCWSWTDEMFEPTEIATSTIEAGDKVRIRKNCTIEELIANKWNLGRRDTLKFFETYNKELSEGTFEVKKVSDRGNIVIEDEDGVELFVNFNALELAEKKVVKEMTIAEISEALGYDVKIVK